MSKYTEAIESLGTIFKCHVCDMEVANCMECDFLHDTCLEALQIADRLENVGKLGVTCKPQKYGSKTEAFADGYKQALSDIRGDTE